jgi:hypothetical protein
MTRSPRNYALLLDSYDKQDGRRKRKPRGIGALQLGDEARKRPGRPARLLDLLPGHSAAATNGWPAALASAQRHCHGVHLESSVGHALAEPLMCRLRSPTKSGVIV